jgi:hypothetical protein
MSYREKTQRDATVYQNLLFLILNEAQHVSGATPPIIRSLKLHKQPLVLHAWKVVGRSEIINFDTLLHLVGFFHCKNCIMMHGSTHIKLVHVVYALL